MFSSPSLVLIAVVPRQNASDQFLMLSKLVLTHALQTLKSSHLANIESFNIVSTHSSTF
jgi:hypothetical protein